MLFGAKWYCRRYGTDFNSRNGWGRDNTYSKICVHSRKIRISAHENARLLREYLILNGAEITADIMFESGGKFYTVIKGCRRGNKTEYTSEELEYGKALDSDTTRKFLKSELAKKESYLKNPVSDAARKKITEEINTIKEVLNGDNR